MLADLDGYLEFCQLRGWLIPEVGPLFQSA